MPKGTVKWFNQVRGYGFIAQDGGGDAFVHITAVQSAGRISLEEGEKIGFELEDQPDGRSSAVRLVLNGSGADASADLAPERGTVKWFERIRGYGFIKPDSGATDVFVHISAAERAGYTTLLEGQRFEYRLVTKRGRTSAEYLVRID